VSLVARHAALTDIGLHRTTNEDSFVAEPPLFAVADGMGGARAGEVASALALETLAEALAGRADLGAAALSANGRVWREARSDRARSGMGTTLTAALLRGDRLEYAHVGDSRLYLWRDDRLEQVTDDHSLVGEMMREGHLTREAAQTHPQRSILSRALGTEPDVQIDTGELPLRAGDAVLLCSDGLSSMVTDDTIAAVLAAVDDPVRVARRLVSEAKSGGGHDNITVVVLRFDQAGGDQTEDADDAPAAGGTPAAAPAQLSFDAPAEGAPPDQPMTPAEGATPAEPAAPDQPATPTDEAAAGGRQEPVGAPRRRRLRLWLVVVLVVVLAAGLGTGAALSSVYFVGDHDGMVSVFHGVPVTVAGVKLYGLYLETTTPLAQVRPAILARVERHDLHRKAAALALAREAQGPP
jgi:protein phosphatase